jgi:hypothetical protein
MKKYLYIYKLTKDNISRWHTHYSNSQGEKCIYCGTIAEIAEYLKELGFEVIGYVGGLHIKIGVGVSYRLRGVDIGFSPQYIIYLMLTGQLEVKKGELEKFYHAI